MKPIFLLAICVLLLSACGPTPTQPPTATPPPVDSSPTALPCNANLAQPTPAPGESVFPPVTAKDWIKGPADAAVTFIIYNDFQCDQCNEQVLATLMEMHPNDVRLVFRPFPQPELFDKGLLAAQAAEAAGVQGDFWGMHDLLFEKQAQWKNLSPEEFVTWVAGEAEGLGLKRSKFESDLFSERIVTKIQKAVEDGKAAGIPVLPLVLLNGQIYSAPKELYYFDQIVRLTVLAKKQFTSCPQMEIDPRKQYLATLETKYGEVVIELYADKAPLTVNSFVFLARRGWFDNITFHRVIPGFVAQTGDPSGTGLGGPGYIFQNEIAPSLRFDRPGMVGMANSGPDTNGSQFFITLAPQTDLSGFYTIFGHVILGMEYLARLTPRDPSADSAQPMLPDGDLLISVTIDER